MIAEKVNISEVLYAKKIFLKKLLTKEKVGDTIKPIKHIGFIVLKGEDIMHKRMCPRTGLKN